MTSTVWISVRWSCHIWKAKRHFISDLRNESQELNKNVDVLQLPTPERPPPEMYLNGNSSILITQPKTVIANRHMLIINF